MKIRVDFCAAPPCGMWRGAYVLDLLSLSSQKFHGRRRTSEKRREERERWSKMPLARPCMEHEQSTRKEGRKMGQKAPAAAAAAVQAATSARGGQTDGRGPPPPPSVRRTKDARTEAEGGREKFMLEERSDRSVRKCLSAVYEKVSRSRNGMSVKSNQT